MLFFEIVGVITTTVVVLAVLGVVYWMFVHPVFQAISVVRWKKACLRKAGSESNISFKTQTNIFRDYYQVGGFSCQRMWNNYGEWYGIGRWRVFEPEDYEAP